MGAQQSPKLGRFSVQPQSARSRYKVDRSEEIERVLTDART
ncbi:hypothetical protein [Methylocaldum sp.]|nr:hypothetical protein [Methylocaldum sp.]HYE37160.1 hypothetical protein [Methylocaldum sp.]